MYPKSDKTPIPTARSRLRQNRMRAPMPTGRGSPPMDKRTHLPDGLRGYVPTARSATLGEPDATGGSAVLADQLGVDLDDLVLVASSDTSYTFRQKAVIRSTRFKVRTGPEGPVLLEDDRGPVNESDQMS